MRAWFLNLLAERELEGRPVSDELAKMAAQQARAVAAELVPEGEPWFSYGGSASADEARAWCATPLAVASFPATLDAPPVEAIRRANHRRLATELHPWRGARMLRSLDDLESLGEGAWMFKGAWGFAGRDQRRHMGPVDDELRAWAGRQIRRGGLRVEPFVSLSCEAGTPGWIGTSGDVRIGEPVRQIARRGQWVRSERWSAPTRVRRALQDSCARVADALYGLGYFGPFGVDAFESEGEWNVLSEINARYSMGWAQGWDERPDLD